jgi:hypothetical protein
MVPSYAAGMSLTDAGRSSRAVEGVLVYRDMLPITGQQSKSVLQPHNVGVDQRASAELLGQLGYAEREQPPRPAGRLSTVQLSIKCSQSQNSRMLEIQRMVSYFFFWAAFKHGQHMIKYAMRQGCMVKSNGSPLPGGGRGATMSCGRKVALAARGDLPGSKRQHAAGR